MPPKKKQQEEEQDKLTRIAIVSTDKCKPKRCRYGHLIMWMKRIVIVIIEDHIFRCLSLKEIKIQARVQEKLSCGSDGKALYRGHSQR